MRLCKDRVTSISITCKLAQTARQVSTGIELLGPFTIIVAIAGPLLNLNAVTAGYRPPSPRPSSIVRTEESTRVQHRWDQKEGKKKKKGHQQTTNTVK